LELSKRICERLRSISALEAELVDEVAAFDRAEAWRGDGSFSMTTWLVSTCHVSTQRARNLATAGAALARFPLLRQELAAGKIPLDVLLPLLPYAKKRNEAELAEQAQNLTPRGARLLAAQLRGPRKGDDERGQVRRRVHFNDENHSLWVQLTKDGYAKVKAAISARARIFSHVSANDEDFEPFTARCADALVELCCLGGRSAGSASAPIGPTVTMVVHVDLETLLQGDGYGLASIEGVGPISAEMARRLACDADITVSFEGPDGSCLDQRPFEREPSPAQRIEIRRRDGGCRFAGCECTEVTDVHHVIWASKQGPSVLSNLLTLCVGHHSRVHELGWNLDGDANGKVTFTSPTGRRYTSMPQPIWRRSSKLRR
jgi:hypothetical protein